MVSTASLQVDGFMAEIDSETGQIRAVHDDLTDRQTAQVAKSTLWSAIGTGGGAVGSTLALGSTTATAGNWVGAAFGGVGAFFGFRGWLQGGRGPKGCFPNVGDSKQCFQRKDDEVCGADEPPSSCSPTMLYQLTFPERDADADIDFHSKYDLPIEDYLGYRRRRERLIEPWIEEAKADKKKKPGDPTDPLNACPNYVLKSEKPFLFASNKNPIKLSIAELTERANKLADLRSVVARMNRDLSRLMEDLATGLQCTWPEHSVKEERSPGSSHGATVAQSVEH